MVASLLTHAPGPEEAPAFDPVFVTDGDLDDLSTFFGLSPDACRQRLGSYSSRELADRWRADAPETPEEITAFYRGADLYIWELMQWHASAARRPYHEALTWVIAHAPPVAGRRRVLDFGGGVGTDALVLAQAGCDVTLVDVDGPGYRFARHRFARRGIAARFLESRWPLPALGGPYDVVVCFDVFEHLPDPLGAARRLIGALRPGGLLVQRATFFDEGANPCHLHANIARFDGLRWHIWMAGLGLRAVGGFVYRKCTLLESVLQRLRFLSWRATGIWPVFPRRRVRP